MLMMEPSTRFRQLIGQLLKPPTPRQVVVAQESGGRRETSEPLLNYPRLSICLTRQADYRITTSQSSQELSIGRHEALFHAPGCHSQSQGSARYRSLGIVFHDRFTLYLLAKKIPGGPMDSGHRFLHQHQVPAVLDEDGRAIARAVVHAADRDRQDDYLCLLVRLLLIRAGELLTLDGDRQSGSLERSGGYFRWQTACHFIQEHHRQPIGRQDVADFLHLHPNHVSRLFKQFGQQTFNQYLNQVRLQRARNLLGDASRSVSEVAYLSGFSSLNYFVWAYRRAYGRSPGKDRWTAAAGTGKMRN